MIFRYDFPGNTHQDDLKCCTVKVDMTTCGAVPLFIRDPAVSGSEGLLVLYWKDGAIYPHEGDDTPIESLAPLALELERRRAGAVAKGQRLRKAMQAMWTVMMDNELAGHFPEKMLLKIDKLTGSTKAYERALNRPSGRRTQQPQKPWQPVARGQGTATEWVMLVRAEQNQIIALYPNWDIEALRNHRWFRVGAPAAKSEHGGGAQSAGFERIVTKDIKVELEPLTPEQTEAARFNRIDELVLELCQILPTREIVMDIDDATMCNIAAVYHRPHPPGHEPDEDDRPCPRLEYEVSDGLPGNRASSYDVDTYAEALRLLPVMKDEFLKARKKNRGY